MKKARLKHLLNEAAIRKDGPNIVAIGGGTGLSVLLRGLKRYTSNITAIVTVADDGGSSGMLREDMGILPPGDIRNCIMALANTEPVMERLMQYRFTEGVLKGQSFGNLLIAALNDISGSFDAAIKEISNVLAVTGKVLPVTLEDIILFAELEDGTLIKGESQIPIKQQNFNKKIRSVTLKPEDCKPLPEALEAIKNADAIIMGPGSLYTSVIPNLLVKGISEAISQSNSIKIYVCNIMTQLGETIGYTLSEHVNAINTHAGQELIQYVIANIGDIPAELIQKYQSENAAPVVIDYENLKDKNIKVVTGNFVDIKNGYLRHNFNALTEGILNLIKEEMLASYKRRIIEYYNIDGKRKKYKLKKKN